MFTIEQCVMCGCKDVRNQTLTIPVNMQGIVSVNVLGAKCSNPDCLEEYYDNVDAGVIRELKELIKRQALIGRINPLHLQSEDYRISSAEAARDNDAKEISFVVKENESDEVNKEYIDTRELDELWKQAIGIEEYERRKALHEKRKQRADYNKDDLNIPECVFCGSDDVPNVTLDIELQPNINQVISINFKIRAAKCSKCGEEYYDSETTELLSNIEKLIETKSNL
ncbi:hypothetical protein [Brevibacillus parabrevis]|uniref:hypothetical protein n=1 Tax=Brevibacillus parabrevis TaxID=54914 RepID=UPI0028D3A169|nr:hypothetical protein [Brevibacillus parabrevis]